MSFDASQIDARNALIQKWLEAQKELESAKEREIHLRQCICNEFFPVTEEGTETIELGNGYKLKAAFKLNRTLNNKDDAVDKVLVKIEKTGDEGKFIADRLVSWKPSLSINEYRKLEPKYKKLIDEVVSSSPGTPTLEFVEPKAKP